MNTAIRLIKIAWYTVVIIALLSLMLAFAAVFISLCIAVYINVIDNVDIALKDFMIAGVIATTFIVMLYLLTHATDMISSSWLKIKQLIQHII